MRAVIYRDFGGPITVEEVPDPDVTDDGAIIEVAACGVCRSDYHGWMGRDDLVSLPHVPGHEMAGTVREVGAAVETVAVGDAVIVPFATGCGECVPCRGGNSQVCDVGYQPGFSGWGGFAELALVPGADRNLVEIPEGLSWEAASLLGCRFGTAYRAVVERAALAAGQWVAIHGCGGLGLSAVMIASALGAKVIAVDVDQRALELAASVGALLTLCVTPGETVGEMIRDISGGGVDVSIDALGRSEIVADSVMALRKQGRHVQIGLLHDGPTGVPMDSVIARELEILGSHGLAAAGYGDLFSLIETSEMELEALVTGNITLDEVADALESMGRFAHPGVSVVTQFEAPPDH